MCNLCKQQIYFVCNANHNDGSHAMRIFPSRITYWKGLHRGAILKIANVNCQEWRHGKTGLCCCVKNIAYYLFIYYDSYGTLDHSIIGTKIIWLQSTKYILHKTFFILVNTFLIYNFKNFWMVFSTWLIKTHYSICLKWAIPLFLILSGNLI